MTCTKPPQGWKCTRTENHEGPCAAMPDNVQLPQRPPQDVEEALTEWRKDREHELYGHRQSFRDGFAAGKASQTDLHSLIALLRELQDGEWCVYGHLADSFRGFLKKYEVQRPDYNTCDDATAQAS